MAKSVPYELEAVELYYDSEHGATLVDTCRFSPPDDNVTRVYQPTQASCDRLARAFERAASEGWGRLVFSVEQTGFWVDLWL